MKKALLFFLCFSFVLSALFAQAEIKFGGLMGAGAVLAKDSIVSGVKPDPMTETFWDFNFNASVVLSDGQLGGKGSYEGGQYPWVYVWWKPFDIFLIKVGNIFEDSSWAGPDTAGYGLNGNDFNVRPDFGGDNGFPGFVLPNAAGFYTGFPSKGESKLQLSFFPTENLDVNFGFLMLTDQKINENYVDNLNVQVVYRFDGIGEAALSFVNAPKGGVKNFYAQWKMSLTYIMNLEAGINYSLTEKDEPEEPLIIGLGWNMGSFEDNDMMVLTSRLGVRVPLEEDDSPRVGWDFVFSYDFFRLFRLYIPVGLGLRLPATGVIYAWNFNPYIAKNIDGINFFGGVQLYNGGSSWGGERINLRNTINRNNQDTINWSIPIGLRWEF